MLSFHVLLSALALMAVSAEAWWFGSSSSSSTKPEPSDTDLRGSALRDLLNSPVVHAEKVERPLSFMPFDLMYKDISHSGVKVTLPDTSEWLIHKGSNHGISSQTVVTSADHMSSKWRSTGETRDFNGERTVSELLEAGGEEYNVLKANCHDAADAIMNLGN